MTHLVQTTIALGYYGNYYVCYNYMIPFKYFGLCFIIQNNKKIKFIRYKKIFH